MPGRRLLRSNGAAVVLLAASIQTQYAGAEAQTSFAREWQAATPVVVTGRLTALSIDRFAEGRADRMYMVRDEHSGKSFTLRFEAAVPRNLRSGARVTVRGRHNGSTIYLAASDGASITMQSNGSVESGITVSGDQRTLVIVTNFSDKVLNPLNPGADCSVAAINDRLFTDPSDYSVDDLYREMSGGTLSFSGTVVGPYTLPVVSTEACDLDGWSRAADTAAAATGVDLAAFPRRVYVMPSNPVCGAAGIGELGVTPSRAWVFTCDLHRTYAHELGHNLGMHHSSTESDEYGDDSDPMGSMGMLKPVNAPHKVQMGWVSSARVMDVAADGMYDVAPLALDGATAVAPQVLRAARAGATDYFYVSYRRPSSGFESNLIPQYADRINVHRWAGGSSRSYLLATIDAGQTFVDTTTGFSVTHASRNDAFASVQIKLGNGCTTAAPVLTLSPSDQIGSAGTRASYDVAVANRNGTACPSSSLALAAAVPSGWTSDWSVPSLTLASGETGHVTLTVTPPVAASNGTYPVTAKASNLQTGIPNASASGTYTVAPGDVMPPSAPATLTAKVKNRQVYLSWSAAVDNVAVAGYDVWRNGVRIATTTNRSWTDATVSTGVTYTYWIIAFDDARNHSAGSNTAVAYLSGRAR